MKKQQQQHEASASAVYLNLLHFFHLFVLVDDFPL